MTRILEALRPSFISSPDYTRTLDGQPFLPPQERTSSNGRGRRVVASLGAVSVALAACSAPDGRVPVIPVPGISSEAWPNTATTPAPIPPTTEVSTPTPSVETPTKEPHDPEIDSSIHALGNDVNHYVNWAKGNYGENDLYFSDTSGPSIYQEMVVDTGTYNAPSGGDEYRFYVVGATTAKTYEGKPSEEGPVSKVVLCVCRGNKGDPYNKDNPINLYILEQANDGWSITHKSAGDQEFVTTEIYYPGDNPAFEAALGEVRGIFDSAKERERITC